MNHPNLAFCLCLFLSCAGGRTGPAVMPTTTPIPNPASLPSATVAAAPPILTFTSPLSAVAGTPALALMVGGANFTATTVVRIDGEARATSFVSGTRLQATLGPQDLATARMATVSVTDPSAPATIPSYRPFSIGNFSTLVVDLATNDLVWDPVHQLLYASVGATSAQYANAIVAIDPGTGAITATAPAGGEPGTLALSDDGSFLYVSLDASAGIQRYLLPGFTPELSLALGSDPLFGPYHVASMQVAPGLPHTLAVSRGCQVEPSAIGGVVIFDDAVPRPAVCKVLGTCFDSIQWAPDDRFLYGEDAESTGYDYYRLPVAADGVRLDQDIVQAFTGFTATLHMDAGNGLLYSDCGMVFDPVLARPAGWFQANLLGGGRMAPDSALNRAYFLGKGTAEVDGYLGTFGLQIFNLTTFTLTDYGTEFALRPVVNQGGIVPMPSRLVRWGSGGLAWGGGGGGVYILSGPLVMGN